MENQTPDLNLIAEARAALADRLVTPWWYHPALGLLLAGFIVAVGLGGTTARAVATVVFVSGCSLLAHSYRRLTGVWVSGFQPGRSRPWAVALGLVAVALVALSIAVGSGWALGVLAGAGFLAAVVLGRRFDTVLRADLRSGA